MVRAILAIACALTTAACGFNHGTAAGGDARADGDPDAAHDGTADAAPPCEAIASLGVDVCATMQPGGPIDIATSTTLDTDDGTTNPSNPAVACIAVASGAMPDACVVLATTFTIDANRTLTVTGKRPLVVIATVSIDVEGKLDASSHASGNTGPGTSSGCTYGRAATSGGGGQGGSFQSLGGNGSDQSGASNSSGLAGGVLPMPASLKAGCSGKAGGNTGGQAGPGGGVVLLAAPAMMIGAAGSIDASGGSGQGAAAGNRGGGGAGSGGMIVLDVATITLASGAQVYANGGHGGEGSSTGNQGADGTDPTDASSGGGGGSGGGSSGNGGAGAHGTTAAGNGSSASSGDGGGGGGGGIGWMFVRSSSSVAGSGVSPAATAFTN
jgi:hypothetical protein